MSKDKPFDPSEIVVHHFPDRSMRGIAGFAGSGTVQNIDDIQI